MISDTTLTMTGPGSHARSVWPVATLGAMLLLIAGLVVQLALVTLTAQPTAAPASVATTAAPAAAPVHPAALVQR